MKVSEKRVLRNVALVQSPPRLIDTMKNQGGLAGWPSGIILSKQTLWHLSAAVNPESTGFRVSK